MSGELLHTYVRACKADWGCNRIGRSERLAAEPLCCEHSRTRSSLNPSESLPCADVANRARHVLQNARSGCCPQLLKLGSLRNQVPQCGV